MRHNTIASAVERGVITATQAFMITECLSASIVFDGCTQIKLEDYDSETDGAISYLLADSELENFVCERFFIPELNNIKTDDKNIWRVYAMTMPYSFLGHIEKYPIETDELVSNQLVN